MARAPKFDLAVLAAVLLSEGEPSPAQLHALLERAIHLGRLGCVDWREETAGIVNAGNKMLQCVSAVGFDWSFIDHLGDIGEGEVLRNNNVLCHLRDQLAQVGLRLVHLEVGDDAYRFAILVPEAFERIHRMAKKNVMKITDDFGPDEFYAQGKVHLKVAGFAQAANANERAQLEVKQRARRIKSLRKLLDDEAELHPDEAVDSLVAPYARFTFPPQLDTGHDTWRISMKLGLHTSWAQRRASRRLLLGEAKMAPELLDCWRLRLLERMFLECAYLDSLGEYPKLADLLDRVSFYEANKFWELTVAATALYCFGYEAEWRQCAALYALFERRLAVSGGQQPEVERMQLALVRFLGTANPAGAHLDTLAASAPFGPLFGAWDKDKHFAQALGELCDWHLTKCHVALTGYDDIHAPGYDFFPTWILAIDRQRERALGRSSLPQHDVLALARPYLNANYVGPEGALVREARALYERACGKTPAQFIEAWDRYFKANGSPA
jgi:hypothetical protein